MSAITVDMSTTMLYQLVERDGLRIFITALRAVGVTAGVSTRDRIIGVSVDLFGSRGVDAVSLDEIAREVGIRKQTVLYWFASKDALVDGVLDAVAAELFVVIDAAVRAAPDDPLERIDNIVRAVFRPAVRRPALLGLFREVSRLDVDQADRLRLRIEPLVERAVSYLAEEMEADRLRQGDPGLVAALGYATLTGIATEPEALRAVGWKPTAAGLRKLRDELRAFLRAALAP
ncbi:MAG: TetR/AcrR family transcriptional regulator [Ilumatobacter sp.]|nr:TetR/AcrR family transcriptional regulator [Ilumatobacter sp.]NKB40439.1 TetR family transcriptional regulator [Ilumatobacter sp.]